MSCLTSPRNACLPSNAIITHACMHAGILFWDVTTIFLNPTAFQYTIDLLVKQYRDQKIDVVAGFEARGLIFGAPLALALGVAFVPLRKPGKLPGQRVWFWCSRIRPRSALGLGSGFRAMVRPRVGVRV